MFSFFKKERPKEDTVTWSPPADKSSEIDELALCTNCEFKGKCRLNHGCKSFNDVVKNRRKRVSEVRGIVESDVKRKEPRYLRNLQWSDKINDHIIAYFKIIRVESDQAIFEVGMRDLNNHKTWRLPNLIVGIPMILNDFNEEVVNFSQFRARARNMVSNNRKDK